MIKAIIFDLDGVLVDTKLIHFLALNDSLIANQISSIEYEDHIKIYDGLPTSEKLNLLNKKNKISPKKVLEIKKLKQINTIKHLNIINHTT